MGRAPGEQCSAVFRAYNRAVWDNLGWWPRLAARLVGRSFTLSDSPKIRPKGMPVIAWLRYGRAGASWWLLCHTGSAELQDNWRKGLAHHDWLPRARGL